MPYVSYAYYEGEYMGDMVDEADFPSIEAQAERIIDVVTGYAIKREGFESFPEYIQNMIKDAVCAQIDYYGYYGVEISLSGKGIDSFTVGKVSVSEGSSASAFEARNNALCPMAQSILEQTGLLYRGIPVAAEPFLPFPWG